MNSFTRKGSAENSLPEPKKYEAVIGEKEIAKANVDIDFGWLSPVISIAF